MLRPEYGFPGASTAGAAIIRASILSAIVIHSTAEVEENGPYHWVPPQTTVVPMIGWASGSVAVNQIGAMAAGAEYSFESTLENFYVQLLGEQQSLGEKFSSIVEVGLWDLYARS